MEVPVETQIPLFLKVLTFDRRLYAGTRGDFVFAIAYQSGFRASAQAKDAAVRTIRSVLRSPGELQLVIVEIDLDKQSLADELSRHNVSAMYVAPLRGIEVKAISAAARSAQVTTVTGVPLYVPLGLAVSVRLRADRPKLVVGVDAARLEGADFTAGLLSLSEIWR